MNSNSKRLSNSFSTGGGGTHFEAHVQASFVALMLTGGHAPCLPCWPITEIKLQGKIDGFDTDDLIVTVVKSDTKERSKLLGQIKHSISITKNNPVFAEVIQAAWNDFNNSMVFSKNKDIIALITGPLNATDARTVPWLLNQARHTNEVDEFFRHVEQVHFSPNKSGEKLAVIQHHLKAANNGTDVSKVDFYGFLKHFHLLGYDLGTEFGVVLSLLHSHISQFSRQYPQWVWSRVVDIVQTWNQDAGTITSEKLPFDLKDVFRQPVVALFPKEFATPKPEPAETDWKQHQYATDLALANLVGAWNEKNEADIAVLTKLLGKKYDDWVQKAREILRLPDCPFSLKNGQWELTKRTELWDLLGSLIFDQNLDAFKAAVVAVLTEHDPSFELPAEERYTASIHGKVLTRSSALRKGLAEGLAILGSNPGALVNCSEGKAEAISLLAIRDVFDNADWVLWGSLNSLLPTLAEAAPNEFLNVVENTLLLSPCPFDDLFAQEGNAITGGNYLTGLLWALEGLAWDDKWLIRVCVVLGELASHDPGGNWANRPGNSLTTILLPWRPQTVASIKKRKVAVQTLCKEWPDIGWNLIISLLPNQVQTSTGSHKPSWRMTISDNWEKDVPPDEYWQQVSFYAELAVSNADNDTGKLVELIDNFDNLPRQSFDQLFKILSSEATLSFPEEQRILLWESLAKFTSTHRRFAGAEWALGDDLLTSIEAVANNLAPSNPMHLYQHLFSDRYFDFYEEDDNLDDQEQKQETRRHDALVEIFKTDGIDGVIQFAESVTSPEQVGITLGSISESKNDTTLLPLYLDSENIKLSSFANGFVWKRYLVNGWDWVDRLDKSAWDNRQVGCFLSYLPFEKESWDRAQKWLGKSQGYYWSKTNANAYQADGDIDVAIDKLIEYERPYAAIRCLSRMHRSKQPINTSLCIKTLLAAPSSAEPAHGISEHQILELVKFLQTHSEVSTDELARVEWVYISILYNRRGARGAVAKTLENRLANDPEFFCEVIQLGYRSRNEVSPQHETSKTAMANATNAYRLLHEWRTPPGMQEDGNFNERQFLSWLQHVSNICEKSGHLEVALISIGGVLIHTPADTSGLWINSTVAEALNALDANDMREGFRTGFYNSRGVYTVDPTGKPERELGHQFRQKAEDVENAGFHRVAFTLREIADRYEHEAERIVK